MKAFVVFGILAVIAGCHSYPAEEAVKIPTEEAEKVSSGLGKPFDSTGNVAYPAGKVGKIVGNNAIARGMGNVVDPAVRNYNIEATLAKLTGGAVNTAVKVGSIVGNAVGPALSDPNFGAALAKITGDAVNTAGGIGNAADPAVSDPSLGASLVKSTNDAVTSPIAGGAGLKLHPCEGNRCPGNSVPKKPCKNNCGNDKEEPGFPSQHSEKREIPRFCQCELNKEKCNGRCASCGQLCGGKGKGHGVGNGNEN